MATWTCIECCDTETIDRGGREIACPYCPRTIKITGLSHGIGGYADEYETATASTGSTITFTGTAEAILADVARVTRYATRPSARRSTQPGRAANSRAGSWAVAIERRVREALAA